MADNNSNFAASPYPVYNFGGGDDDSVQQAVLTSHTGASVERNQDAQFASLSRQGLHRDIVGGTKDSQLSSAELKFELATQVKDSEIRSADRFSELKDLIHAQAARDLADVKADLRAARQEAMLQQILTKLSTP